MGAYGGHPEVRPDGGVNMVFGTWGYDGPRWFMQGRKPDEHYYFADDREEAALKVSAAHGQPLQDLWATAEDPPDRKVEQHG